MDVIADVVVPEAFSNVVRCSVVVLSGAHLLLSLNFVDYFNRQQYSNDNSCTAQLPQPPVVLRWRRREGTGS